MDPVQDDNEIVDAQVIEPANGAEVLINLESMIKNHIAQIDKVTEDLKKHKDMLDDIFANDSTYKQHDEVAKEAAKIRNATKAQIMKQPQAADLSNKVKVYRGEVKELKMALSDYLREFQRMSGGVNEIEGEDGEVREIVYTAKLVKRGLKFK